MFFKNELNCANLSVSSNHEKYCTITVPIAEILSLKNAHAWVSMFFTLNEKSTPIATEKIEILGAVLGLPAYSIETHARTLLPLNISAVGCVSYIM